MEKSSPQNKNKKELKEEKDSKKKIETDTKMTTIKTYDFPKNTNEYRHLIDDIKCCKSDIEFMLALRRYNQIKNIDKVSFAEPSFYQNELNKYKEKNALSPDEKKLLQVNIGNYKYLLSDRSDHKININNPTFKYEIRLRNDGPIYKSADKIYKTVENESKKKSFKNIILNRPSWDSSNIPKNHSLFGTILPPVLKSSKEMFNKNEKFICRPIIIKRKDAYINGQKIKSRIFEYNNTLASCYPSEHYPNYRYSNDYGQKNIGAIKHLLNYDNITMNSIWSTYLRGIKNKNVSLEEIKKTERKLRDLSEKKGSLK